MQSEREPLTIKAAIRTLRTAGLEFPSAKDANIIKAMTDDELAARPEWTIALAQICLLAAESNAKGEWTM